MHYHRHDDQVLCSGNHNWPEWADALFATLFHIQGEIMTQQDQLNSDVQLLQDALTGIGKELQDYKNAVAAQAPQLDLSGLDAIAQKALNLVPPTPAAAPTDAPAAPAATDAPAAPAADAAPAAPAAPAADATPAVVDPNAQVPTDTGTNPAPNLNM